MHENGEALGPGMSQALAAFASINLPALFAPDEGAARRFIEFFTANIRNPNTRRAYFGAVAAFAEWCEQRGARELRAIEPIHVAAYVEVLQMRLGVPSVKVHLAAIRMLFDWLVVGQVVPSNPALSVRGPKYSVRTGKTPVPCAEDARALFGSIDVTTLVGLRDRAFLGVMVYTFGRVGAVVAMRIEDVMMQRRRMSVRLHEKGGKLLDVPCNHNLEEYLQTYIDAAGIQHDKKRFLFRTAPGWSGKLSEKPLSQSDALRMVKRRWEQAGIETDICNHSFRGLGITEFLSNGGSLEDAQRLANHADPRTTRLYDRREDRITLDVVERIVI